MLKRVLVSGAVVLGLVAAIACSGDSGGDGGLTQKPTIMTSRDVVADTLFTGQGRDQTLLVTNKGVEDLVISNLALTGDPSLIGGAGSGKPFVLQSQYVIQLLPDGGVTTDASGNTIKSNQSGFISLHFTGMTVVGNPADGGYTVDAGLTITSNADNAPSKQIGLQITSATP
jgi:hypothetical protein